VALVSLRNVSKAYRMHGLETLVLKGIDLDVAPQTLIALMGPSGCGKSSLLNLLALIDQADSGSIVIAGHEVSALSDARLTFLRREVVGYVSQFFNLLPTLTLLENVQLPLTLLGWRPRQSRVAALELLVDLGLETQVQKFPYQVSGGQMQRVAIARAIVHNPPLLLADEPTGNLDSTNGAHILQIFARLARERGLTVLMATHSPDAAAICDTMLHMHDGRLQTPIPGGHS